MLDLTRFTDAGRPVFPIMGKRSWPRGSSWKDIASADSKDWPAELPEYAGYGVVTGSGLVVVDLDLVPPGETFAGVWTDVPEVFDDPPEVIAERFPDTFRVRSRRGFHLYYATSRPVGNRAKLFGGRVDIRGDGGYVVGFGSPWSVDAWTPDPEGRYTVEHEAPYADAPEWLYRARTAEAPVNAPDAEPCAITWLVEPELRKAQDAVKGARSERLHALVGACRDAGLSLANAVYVATLAPPLVEKYGKRLGTEVARSWGRVEVKTLPPPESPEYIDAFKRLYPNTWEYLVQTGASPYELLGRVVAGARRATGYGPSSGSRPVMPNEVLGQLDSMERIEPNVLGMFYPGRINGLSGQWESWKTWLAATAAVEVLDAGGWVVVKDYESTYLDWFERLVMLGADGLAVRDRFVYIGGDRFTDDGLREMAAWADAADLIIFDSVNRSIAAEGGDHKKGSDINAWNNRVIRPLNGRRACVLLIDHEGFNAQGRPDQSHEKLDNITGAGFSCKKGVPAPSEDGIGYIELSREKYKDRYGRTPVTVRGTVNSRGDRIVVTLEAEGLITKPFTPGHTVETEVREYLSEHREAKNTTELARALGYTTDGGRQKVSRAVATLRDAGDVTKRGHVLIWSGPT